MLVGTQKQPMKCQDIQTLRAYLQVMHVNVMFQETSNSLLMPVKHSTDWRSAYANAYRIVSWLSPYCKLLVRKVATKTEGQETCPMSFPRVGELWLIWFLKLTSKSGSMTREHYIILHFLDLSGHLQPLCGLSLTRSGTDKDISSSVHCWKILV